MIPFSIRVQNLTMSILHFAYFFKVAVVNFIYNAVN